MTVFVVEFVAHRLPSRAGLSPLRLEPIAALASSNAPRRCSCAADILSKSRMDSGRNRDRNLAGAWCHRLVSRASKYLQTTALCGTLDVRLRPIIARALAQTASRARGLDASQCRHPSQVRVSPIMAKCAWPALVSLCSGDRPIEMFRADHLIDSRRSNSSSPLIVDLHVMTIV